MDPIKGLHHITAVTRDVQLNVDFYRNILGQRLVKRTVNFDSPDSYHFYFADEVGMPGTVLTSLRGQISNAGLVETGKLQQWHITSRPTPLAFGGIIFKTEGLLSSP